MIGEQLKRQDGQDRLQDPVGRGYVDDLVGDLGDPVVALGNSFGFGQTVSAGVVSGKGRSDLGIVAYEDFIQTDTAINPGNSGGALLNLRGELVGINTALLTKSGTFEGVGLAIPSNLAGSVMRSLREDGRVIRGYLGASAQDVDEKLARADVTYRPRKVRPTARRISRGVRPSPGLS